MHNELSVCLPICHINRSKAIQRRNARKIQNGTVSSSIVESTVHDELSPQFVPQAPCTAGYGARLRSRFAFGKVTQAHARAVTVAAQQSKTWFCCAVWASASLLLSCLSLYHMPFYRWHEVQHIFLYWLNQCCYVTQTGSNPLQCWKQKQKQICIQPLGFESAVSVVVTRRPTHTLHSVKVTVNPCISMRPTKGSPWTRRILFQIKMTPARTLNIIFWGSGSSGCFMGARDGLFTKSSFVVAFTVCVCT